MPEPTNIAFTHREVAELLARHANITSGHWGISIKFGLAASNIGPDKENMCPAAIVPVIEIAIRQYDEPSNLTIDAAQIKPLKVIKAASKKTKQVKRNSRQ